jgi:hypothetical protein
MDMFETQPRRTLLDVAQELFADTANPEVIEQSYRRDTRLTNEIPLAARRCIFRASQRYYHSGDGDFHVDIPLEGNLAMDQKDGITEDDLKILRPIFAASYLDHAGITNTEESVRLAQKLVPISLNHIEVQTQKKGYLHDKLVVFQYQKQHAQERPTRQDLSLKCDLVRHQMKHAWGEVETYFPDDPRPEPPIPFRSKLRTRSQRALELTRPVRKRCPSALPLAKRSLQPKLQKDPFTEPWMLLLTREAVGRLVVGFVQTFNVIEYLNTGIEIARKTVETMRNGSAPRIIYHVAHYLHSIFVDHRDSMSEYLRLRALWHLQCKAVDDSMMSYKMLSLALMMIKVCVFITFDEQMGVTDEAHRMVVEVTLFQAIDDLLNPMEIYDSLEKPEDYRVSIRKRHLPRGKRELEDIRDLHVAQALSPFDDNIARMLLNDSRAQLSILLGQEKWGDKGPYEGEETIHKYKMERMTQKLIAHDLERLSQVVPREPPKWITERQSALDRLLQHHFLPPVEATESPIEERSPRPPPALSPVDSP